MFGENYNSKYNSKYNSNYNSKYNSKFYKISKHYANTGSEGGEGIKSKLKTNRSYFQHRGVAILDLFKIFERSG